jgi:hypothetical protein
MDRPDHADTILSLVDHFYDVPINSSSDEFIVALGMTISGEIAARFAPEQWHERVERIAHLIMTDLLGGYASDTSN